jgi:hypothetical protein
VLRLDDDRDREVELLLLRRELSILRRTVKKPRLNPVDRMILAALARRLPRRAWGGLLVRPETLLGWHRALVRRKWAAFGRRRGPGRPRIDGVLAAHLLTGMGESPLGLHMHSRRADRARLRSLRDFDQESNGEARRADAPATIALELARVSPSPGFGARGHRLLHGGTWNLKRLYVLFFMELATRASLGARIPRRN